MDVYLFYFLQASYLILSLFQLLIVVWVIASWMVLFGVLSPAGGIYQGLVRSVEPVIRPFKWARIGMVDLSPVAALLALDYVRYLMVSGG